MSDIATDFDAALKAGTALAEPRVADKDFVSIPDGYRVFDLEAFQARPRRKRGTFTLHETASFIQYFNLHKDDASAVFCERVAGKFTGILDAHDAEPRWGVHRCILQMQITPEWKIWKGSNKELFNQLGFAEFIEANLLDVINPKGAELLEIALTLEEKRTVTFGSVHRLSDGQREFQYEEQLTGGAKKGTMKIPETFTLKIAPFEGSQFQEITARLRYRVKEGAVSFWYDLQRPEDVEEQAVMDAARDIEKDGEVSILYGVPA